MIVKKEITINADTKKIWKIFSQIENWPKLGSYISDARWVSGSRWKANSIFVQKIKGFLFVNSYNSRCKILKITPFKFVEWRGTGKLIQGTHSFKFRKIGKKTEVCNSEYFTGLLAPFIFPFIKKRFGHYFVQFNKGLKKKAEK